MARRIPLENKTWMQLVEELDAIFSYYIRLSWANNDGICSCYTCGNKIFWLYIQNGHFMIRTVWKLRWDEDNCRPQCRPCNGDMGQRRTFDYEYSLKEEIGEERVEEMKGMRHLEAKWEKPEMIAMILDYEKKVEKLQQRIPQKLT